MLRNLLSVGLFTLLGAQSLLAVSATTTFQIVWPQDKLGMDEQQVYDKAVAYLKSEDYANAVAQMANEWREKYSQSAGINDYHNTEAITQSIQQNLDIQGEPEHGVIKLTFTNPDPETALHMAERSARVAVQESHYRVAMKGDTKVQNISAQMEQIEDNIQQLQDMQRAANQQASAPVSRSASIGAPMGMGRSVNPGAMQQRASNSNTQAQIQAARKQYNALNTELQQAIQNSWKGKPKVGLVVIDNADLDS